MLGKTHYLNQQQQALPSHESSNSVAILKKLNSTRSIGQGSGSASNKAKDRYFNQGTVFETMPKEDDEENYDYNHSDDFQR